MGIKEKLKTKLLEINIKYLNLKDAIEETISYRREAFSKEDMIRSIEEALKDTKSALIFTSLPEKIYEDPRISEALGSCRKVKMLIFPYGEGRKKIKEFDWLQNISSEGRVEVREAILPSYRETIITPDMLLLGKYGDPYTTSLLVIRNPPSRLALEEIYTFCREWEVGEELI